MKKYSKMVFSVVFISLLGTVGCKKDTLIEPNDAFTVSSNTFKDGVIDVQFLKNNRIVIPHVEWKNPPVGTKSFSILIEDDKGKTYLFKIVPGDKISLDEERLDDNTYKYINPYKKMNGTTMELKVFALCCSPDELQYAADVMMENTDSGGYVLKDKFKPWIQPGVISNIILGQASLKYKIQR